MILFDDFGPYFQDRINSMIRLDDPEFFRTPTGKEKRRALQVSKLGCSALSCSNGVYENDYLSEAEKNIHGGWKQSPDVDKLSMEKAISKVQDELRALEDNFRTTRSW